MAATSSTDGLCLPLTFAPSHITQRIPTMSSPDNNVSTTSTPSTSRSPMSSTPLQPISPAVALKSHGNDAIHSSLSPADCRTLKKILEDVRTSSQASSQDSEGNNVDTLSRLRNDILSSDDGDEDEAQYSEEQDNLGEETEKEYEDEDRSIELNDGADGDASDGDPVDHAEASQRRSKFMWDGDNIEDIMNMSINVAPPARPRGLSKFLARDSVTPEVKAIRLRHAEIEREVGQEYMQQQKDPLAKMDSCSNMYDITNEERDVTVHLFASSAFQAAQELQAASEQLQAQPENESQDRVQMFLASDRRASRRFSPSTLPLAISKPSSPIVVSNAAMLSVTRTTKARYIDIAPDAVTTDTPFKKTRRYYKQHNGKENSPSKSRRNASLPDEIAQLAREAKEEDDLEQYRDIDLAPMEPVMASDSAGDLITLGTPLKAKNIPPTVRLSSDPRTFLAPVISGFGHTYVGESGISELDLTAASSHASVEFHVGDEALLLTELQEPEEAAQVVVELSVEKFENCDHKPDDINRSTKEHFAHPTFVNVIGMLPRTLFWMVIAPASAAVSMAYDTILATLTGLEL